LKEWHVSHTHNLSGKIASLKDRKTALDGKGEKEELSEEESSELHGISSYIHSLSRLNTSICWQQSRLTWLREGDANSNYFHSVLSSRRRRNSLSSILVNRSLVEGVQPVRQAVFSHFAHHFQVHHISRPTVEDLQFQGLSFVEGAISLSLFRWRRLKRQFGIVIVSRVRVLMASTSVSSKISGLIERGHYEACY